MVLNAIFYVVRGGIAWRYLLREYPPWATVYGYCQRWRLGGGWLARFRPRHPLRLEIVKRSDKDGGVGY
jgi:transposase